MNTETSRQLKEHIETQFNVHLHEIEDAAGWRVWATNVNSIPVNIFSETFEDVPFAPCGKAGEGERIGTLKRIEQFLKEHNGH